MCQIDGREPFCDEVYGRLQLLGEAPNEFIMTVVEPAAQMGPAGRCRPQYVLQDGAEAGSRNLDPTMAAVRREDCADIAKEVDGDEAPRRYDNDVPLVAPAAKHQVQAADTALSH